MKKTLGIEAQPPQEKCEDVKCPWHGKLPIRGKVFDGVVMSTKSTKTAVVEWGYHKYNSKYKRYERRKSRVMAYNPPCIKAKDDEKVMIAECRPLSKTKHFVVVGRVK